jgi:DNA-binding CsgD family transcriptional regulator/PAS domain-containing protein
MLEATGFVGSAFYIVDRIGMRAIEENWHKLDTQYADAYMKDYLPLDPRGARTFAPDGERILYDYLHTAEGEMDRHPFYSWMEKTQGNRYYLGGQSDRNAPLPITLTLHRPRSMGHASADEIARFSRLFDHFEHALRMQHLVGLDATKAAAQAAELEDARHGVVLLDRAGHVLFANASARVVAGRGDGLVLAENGVSARAMADATDLRRRIASAQGGIAAKPLRIARPFGGHPYVVTVFPVPQPGVLVHLGRVSACVRIFDPDTCPNESLLKAAPLLGLTPQETNILGALLEGTETRDIAALFGLRSATVRAYLSSIYRKTGINRQAALVAYAEALRRFLEAR